MINLVQNYSKKIWFFKEKLDWVYVSTYLIRAIHLINKICFLCSSNYLTAEIDPSVWRASCFWLFNDDNIRGIMTSHTRLTQKLGRWILSHFQYLIESVDMPRVSEWSNWRNSWEETFFIRWYERSVTIYNSGRPNLVKDKTHGGGA